MQHQLDAFVESISLYCAPRYVSIISQLSVYSEERLDSSDISDFYFCRVKTNDDQSSSPSQTDANELIRLQAELDEAHAVISVLRGALQLSYAINAKKYPKAR